MKLLLLTCSLLLGQTAMAQAVPQIPFESVPNAIKLPDNMYLGEASGVAVNSKGHIFVFSRSSGAGGNGPAFGSAAAQLLELMLTAISSVRSARTCTPGRLRTPSRSTLKTTSGSPTRAPTWLSSLTRRVTS